MKQMSVFYAKPDPIQKGKFGSAVRTYKKSPRQELRIYEPQEDAALMDATEAGERDAKAVRLFSTQPNDIAEGDGVWLNAKEAEPPDLLCVLVRRLAGRTFVTLEKVIVSGDIHREQGV